MQDYTTKPETYFANARKDIEPLLPARASRVLEVGCGTGSTLRWLKESGRCDEAVGLELFDSAASVARKFADSVTVGDAERLIGDAFELASFDLILCLDVLEHMVDPWAFIAKAEQLLKPGGAIIASIPNVRHLSVLIPLAFAGRWRYQPQGILDRTHLRFFTREGALALLNTKRLSVTRSLRNLPPTSLGGLLNMLTLGLLRDLLAVQFLISARRTADPGVFPRTQGSFERL
jgi:2-polyprenyl-3-methyl-5-hydroxy-6-metoxy-1,4-benzoquinol methylase